MYVMDAAKVGRWCGIDTDQRHWLLSRSRPLALTIRALHQWQEVSPLNLSRNYIYLYVCISVYVYVLLVEIFDIAQQLQVFMYNVFFIRYDLELHMVHVARDPSLKNNIAVVGLFYKIGHHDAFLSKVQIPTQSFFNWNCPFPFVYTLHFTQGTLGLKSKTKQKMSAFKRKK